MNREQIEGNWNEFKGKMRQKWADLTDDDVQRMKGNYEECVGVLQQKYGKTKEEVERQLSEIS
ncbi:MAG: CsbD family protein [Fimbriimonadaceae bacterium]